MESRVRAPQLESPLGWLNTDRPLRIGQELKGHVVVLDFWTYCCINCLHVFPDLKHLEHKYHEQPLVVIGVHSAKFSNEASRQTIRSAIQRYEIEHPVLVDDQMQLWRAYAVRSWPTFVVIDPEGYVALVASGEGQRETLDAAIAGLLSEHRSRGTLASQPLTIRRDAVVRPVSGLAFPGKVLADGEGRRLFLSDSNHNRLVATTWPDERGRCELLAVVGRGTIGATDGSADAATFDHPQGLALSGDTLYVADTENHLIRAVDLQTWAVTTVLGTGRMGYDRAGGARGAQQEISSPWDLAMEGGTLYIAMAGLHQIWRAEMPVGFARALAGNGRENIVDGPMETAALSQPSGLCLHRGKLYFADSEVSALRGIDLAAERVFTVIGQGLFVFGDVDGPHPAARLQHCLGVASWEDVLLVADTYNHKIKVVDPADRSARTLLGTGRPGTAEPDGGLELYEPGGLAVAGETLFIADTNNHRIVAVNLRTRAWSELAIDGLTAPDVDRTTAGGVSAEANAITALPATVLATGQDLDLRLDVRLPAGAHLNTEAPWTLRISAPGRVIAQRTGHGPSLPLAVRLPADGIDDDGTWDISLSLIYCTSESGSRCVPAELAWRVPIRRAPEASSHLSLSTEVLGVSRAEA